MKVLTVAALIEALKSSHEDAEVLMVQGETLFPVVGVSDVDGAESKEVWLTVELEDAPSFKVNLN